MNQTELYNAIVPEDRLMTCWAGCGEVKPVLEEEWRNLNGLPSLEVGGWCPKCRRFIRTARQLKHGSLEVIPW